jgi:hypothetical protein
MLAQQLHIPRLAAFLYGDYVPGLFLKRLLPPPK